MEWISANLSHIAAGFAGGAACVLLVNLGLAVTRRGLVDLVFGILTNGPKFMSHATQALGQVDSLVSTSAGTWRAKRAEARQTTEAELRRQHQNEILRSRQNYEAHSEAVTREHSMQLAKIRQETDLQLAEARRERELAVEEAKTLRMKEKAGHGEKDPVLLPVTVNGQGSI